MEPKLFKDNNLIHAVISCDYETVKKILGSLEYDKECLLDIGGFCKKFPLSIICVCNEIILGNSFDNIESGTPISEKNKIIFHMLSDISGFKNENFIMEDYISYIYGNENEPVTISSPDDLFEEYYKFGFLDELKNHDIPILDLKLYHATYQLKSYHLIKKYCDTGARKDWKIEGVKSPYMYLGEEEQMFNWKEAIDLFLYPKKTDYTIYDIYKIAKCTNDLQINELLTKED